MMNTTRGLKCAPDCGFGVSNMLTVVREVWREGEPEKECDCGGGFDLCVGKPPEQSWAGSARRSVRGRVSGGAGRSSSERAAEGPPALLLTLYICTSLTRCPSPSLLCHALLAPCILPNGKVLEPWDPLCTDPVQDHRCLELLLQRYPEGSMQYLSAYQAVKQTDELTDSRMLRITENGRKC
eukprot:s5841_g2.t1